MKSYKTFIVHENGDSAEYGRTPRTETLGLTPNLYLGAECNFTPLQCEKTRTAKTTITKDTLSLQMWILSETPRLVRMFGKGAVPDRLFPEAIEVEYATDSAAEHWETTRCSVMAGSLVLPKFDTYPVYIKFKTEIN